MHILSLIVFLLHLRVWSKKEHLLQDSTISGLHGFSDLTSSTFWILSLSSHSHPSNYFWAGSHLRFCFTCQKCSSHRLIWLAPPYPSDSCSYIKQLVRQILSILYKIVITLLSTNRHLALSICVMFVKYEQLNLGLNLLSSTDTGSIDLMWYDFDYSLSLLFILVNIFSSFSKGKHNPGTSGCPLRFSAF